MSDFLERLQGGYTPAPDPFLSFSTDSTPSTNQQSRIIFNGKKNEPMLFFGGHLVPSSRAQYHTLVVGATGYGKTLISDPSKAHVYSTLRPGKRDLVIDFDVKGTSIALAHKFAKKQNVPLYWIKFDDPRAHAWDVQDEVLSNPLLLSELIRILIPVQGKDPFWTLATQALVEGVGFALEERYKAGGYSSQGRWGLHDLYNACFSDMDKLTAFLLKCSRNKSIVERVLQSSASNTTAGILMQLQASLREILVAAIHQYHTPKTKWFSFRRMFETGGICVITYNVAMEESTTLLMRSMFKAISNHLLSKPDYPNERTYIYIDELPFFGANLPGLVKVLTNCRSKGGLLYVTAQDYQQLVATYGQEGAETLANNCGIKIIFGTDSPGTAEWAARLSGTERRLDTSFSLGLGSISQNVSIQKRERFEAADFLNMQPASPDYGMEFMFSCPYRKMDKIYLTADEVEYWKPPIDRQLRTRMEKPINQRSMPVWETSFEGIEPSQRAEYINLGTTGFERKLRSEIFDLVQEFIEDAVDGVGG